MKKIISLILVFVLCTFLVSCSVSTEDVVGAWTGSWTYNGNSFVETFVLAEDGVYTSVMYKNGDLHEVENGTYEIEGRKVKLHPDGDENFTTPYEYKNGKLVNNDHEFIKQ